MKKMSRKTDLLVLFWIVAVIAAFLVVRSAQILRFYL